MNPTEQYQATRWSLNSILAAPAGPPVEQALADLESTTAAIEALRPSLSPDMAGADFSQAIALLEKFVRIANRLGSYGPLWFAEDTQNQAALAFMGRMDQLLTEAQIRILFFELWWKGLDDTAAARLLGQVKADLVYYLEQERKLKDHILSEPEERIINTKDVNGINALVTIYDMITNKFVFELEIEGQTKALTRDELMIHVRASDPARRAAAYQKLFEVYGQEAGVLAQIYIHRVRDWTSEHLKLRRYRSPLSVRNMVNDIPDAVTDTLLEVCAEQAGVFHRYFKLKAQWLGLEPGKLRRYDLYAPLSQKSEKTIAYSDAVNIVLNSFAEFSPPVADQARRIFRDGHIDAEVRPKKRGGAFCASILPGMTPLILANYTGEPRQVATLAHELGHAIHALLAADHSVLTFHSALPMAETASVFSEMLLTDRLLAEEKDPLVRRDLLAEAVDDMYATVLRQAYFVIFEREAHRMIGEGASLPELNQQYLAILQQQFGDSLDLSDDFQQEWTVIPHIYHTPFYCYAYSFGQLLALSLYQQYKEVGPAFTPKLLKILAYGGSASPDHILKEAGINMADPDFWRTGFKVIEGLIDEMAGL
jgi:oligoendopeptidase F